MRRGGIKERYLFYKATGRLPYKDGRIDETYYDIMEQVAELNNAEWNRLRREEGGRELSADEEYLRVLNDNAYDYKGYYNKYPNGKGNAIDHWDDEFKTVYRPTFSTLSIYSGKKSLYNPEGVLGGQWLNDLYVPAWGQKLPHYEYGHDAVVDDIINNYEGFLTTPTDIGDGKITIGSGLTNQKWIDKYNKTGRWTKADNYAAVKEEVDSVRKWMPAVVPQYNNLPKGALDVLVDIGYNIGRGGISKSKSPKFHAALERGDWEEAARLMDWGNSLRTSDGRPMGGLLKRNATRQQRFLAAMSTKSNPLDRVNVEQLLEYTTSSWLNRPSYMKNDLEKPMNTPDPIGEFFVKARAGVKAAGTIGNYLRKRQIQQQADIYRKTRQYQSDTENYTGRSLRRENIKEADAYARDSRYRGMYSDNPFIFLYDLFVDPVVQYYTKLQSHPIWGPILP